MKKIMLLLLGALASFAVCADAVPEVSDITMTQGNDSRLVTITYTLANTNAVITLDIQTKATNDTWVSVGGENLQHVSGDVWKKVAAGENHTITWHPDISSLSDHKVTDGNIRAVVTAWSVDNPPDYMVVNLTASAVTNSETYYPAVEFLPGGLLKNTDYRTSHLVMRKIPAKGVTWTMGSVIGELGRVTSDTREAMHTVTFADNYYIAVFETTQMQWGLVQSTANSGQPYFTTEQAMRPMEMVSYNEIRNAANSTTADTTCDYPAVPNSGSFLGLLRAKTGLLFDLPSEAQWEFACRAGHGTGSWGDGSSIANSDNDANLVRLGRVQYNGGKVGGTVDPSATCEVTNGTAIVGSYAPNSWGLYDMHGNVWEWCLDWYEESISAYGGAVNVDLDTPANTLSGTAGENRIIRGGSFCDLASACRAAGRNAIAPSVRNNYNVGFRLALPASPAGASK